MFSNNPKGDGDTIQYQSPVERNDASTRKTKHNQQLDGNVVIFNDMEKHAVEHHSHDSLLVGNLNREPLTEEMNKATDLIAPKNREELTRDSAELKAMKKQLHQACMREDYALQVEEKQHKIQEDKIMDQFHSDQRRADNERHIHEEEEYGEEISRRNVQYGRDLERQIAEKAEKKQEAKRCQNLEGERLTRAEMNRVVLQDQASQEKLDKKSQLRKDMEAAIKVRQEERYEEKMLNKELERNVKSYWEKSSHHEEDLHQEQVSRQQQITERQEICAQALQEINERKQIRSNLLENLSMQNHQTLPDSKTDCRKLRQAEMSSGLNGQVENKGRVKRDVQERGDFNETYMWGSDDVAQRGDQAEQQRRTMECSDYNRATVRRHEVEKESRKFCNQGKEEAENAAEGVFRKRLDEEEKDRALNAEEWVVSQ